MATTAKPTDHPGRVHLRLGSGVDPENLVRLWCKLVAAHDGDAIAAALEVVRILGRDEIEQATVQLARANARFDGWRRQNPRAVMAVPRLRLRRLPRRGHVGARQSRPGARRTTSSASSRGDPDLGDEPPEHRPPSLLGAAA